VCPGPRSPVSRAARRNVAPGVIVGSVERYTASDKEAVPACERRFCGVERTAAVAVPRARAVTASTLNPRLSTPAPTGWLSRAPEKGDRTKNVVEAHRDDGTVRCGDAAGEAKSDQVVGQLSGRAVHGDAVIIAVDGVVDGDQARARLNPNGPSLVGVDQGVRQ